MNFKASIAALVLASCCGRGDFRAVPPYESGHLGGVQAGALFKRPGTFPDLELLAAGETEEKIAIRPYRQTGEKDVFSASDLICASLAVGNFGFGENEEAFEVVLYFDGAPADTWVIVDPVRPGQSVGRSDFVFGPLAPGCHTLRAVVDPANRVGETDESDNEAAVEFFVFEEP